MANDVIVLFGGTWMTTMPEHSNMEQVDSLKELCIPWVMCKQDDPLDPIVLVRVEVEIQDGYLMTKEKERKEQKLRALAQKARSKRVGPSGIVGAGADTLNDNLGHDTFVAGVIAVEDAKFLGFATDTEIYVFRVWLQMH
ncbi:subtilisin-like protease SBT6.1 isoform X1, partial [Tanacetum coccineum]